MGLQRVGHDWATELNWPLISKKSFFDYSCFLTTYYLGSWPADIKFWRAGSLIKKFFSVLLSKETPVFFRGQFKSAPLGPSYILLLVSSKHHGFPCTCMMTKINTGCITFICAIRPLPWMKRWMAGFMCIEASTVGPMCPQTPHPRIQPT